MRGGKIKIATFPAVPLLVLLCLTNLAAAPPSPPKTAPAWELSDLNGKPIRLSDFGGKIVVLNFWATWCPPCRREVPALIAFQKEYADKGVQVVGVSMDKQGATEVASFAKKMGINYPIVLGDQKMSEAYGGIEGIPTTFIIDRQGNVVTAMEGETSRAMLESTVKPLLGR
jgi:cytochrome c biogenesis protein CcmG/thiol:disulfide interchange protein DsbE